MCTDNTLSQKNQKEYMQRKTGDIVEWAKLRLELITEQLRIHKEN